MTLFQIVQALKGIALTSPYIRTAEEGSIYDIMNANPHIKYGTFVISQTNHRQDEFFDHYGFNIFVCDRLKDDLESNRLHIQSTAKEVLANTILTFCTDFYGITHNELNFIPFTEKFVDLTAGQYVQVTFRVPKALNCPDRYMDKYGPDYRLQELVVTVTENGIYEYEPNEEDYDGYKNVKLTVNVPQTGHTDEELEEAYDNGKEDGIEEQKSKLTSTAFTENGTYTREDGYSGITVNVPQTGHTDEELQQAYEDGKKDQKALLEDITVNHNGEYENVNGYGKVTVNVPQTGTSVNNQSKNVTITQNGEQTVTYDSGFTGLENVNISVNVPQTGTTINNQSKTLTITQNGTQRVSYDSGYTGLEDVVVTTNISDRYNEGYSDGEQHQKSLLTTTAFTENGTYTKEDGYSAVTVNIDTEYWYQSGYTDGYEEGKKELKYFVLTVNIGTDVQSEISKLIGSATVTVNFGNSSLTETYNGEELVFEINPGLKYTVSFGGVADFKTPLSHTGVSTWNDSKSIYGNYIYSGAVIPYEEQYLTLEIVSSDTANNTLRFESNYIGFSPAIQVSVNNGEWVNKYFKTDNSEEKSISGLTTGDKIRIRGANNSYYSNTYYCYFNATSRMTVNVYGNIMSLFYQQNFVTATEFVSGSTDNLKNFFQGGNNISFLNANNLILPATTLTKSCYEYMFTNCTSLVSTPELPATTLADWCYYNMFRNCTSLVSTPKLPSTTLANSCYRNMFYECTNLVTAPKLSATTLSDSCYSQMFYGCTSLVNAPELPATTLVHYCYYGMFQGCTSLTAAPALPATTLAEECYDNMFNGCTSLVNAPDLPATTLAYSCYYSMFQGCTSLTTAPDLPATTLDIACYRYMFADCSSLNYIKCLATDISATNCTNNWVNGVSTSGTFVKNASMEDWVSGVNGTPLGWTVENV